MVGEAENEISHKAPKRHEQHPLGPLRGFIFDHAVHDKQKAKSGVSKRGSKRGGIHETLDGPLFEESAIEEQNDARQSNPNGYPTNAITEVFPQRRVAQRSRQER